MWGCSVICAQQAHAGKRLIHLWKNTAHQIAQMGRLHLHSHVAYLGRLNCRGMCRACWVLRHL